MRIVAPTAVAVQLFVTGDVVAKVAQRGRRCGGRLGPVVEGVGLQLADAQFVVAKRGAVAGAQGQRAATLGHLSRAGLYADDAGPPRARQPRVDAQAARFAQYDAGRADVQREARQRGRIRDAHADAAVMQV